MMIRLFLYLLLVHLSVPLMAQDSPKQYNKALADSLGADQYGMKMYQFVILTTGPSLIANKDSVSLIFKGHMENITRLVKEGHLIVAGPFGKNDKKYRGLFIFRTKDQLTTKQLLDTDPAIKTGLLAYELYDWYGSAALPMYLPYSTTISKTDF